MKISVQWLQEMIPGLKAKPEKIADGLTNIGLEVEEILYPAKELGDVVVGQVVDKQQHPNADRLSLCQVKAGKQNLQIVCGAPNVEVGGKYPLAPVGATLPGGFKIGQAKLRGVLSQGMLCSGKELGLSDDSSGLMELESSAKSGQSLVGFLGLKDSIIDIAITPNRGDCLSHVGVANEVAALFGLKVAADKVAPLKAKSKIKNPIKVSVKDKKSCRRYASCTISSIKLAPSPVWLQTRLTLLGVRPINNVVDATNYIMLLTGHPSHAFDKRMIGNDKIIVESLRQKQDFVTLDGEKHTLVPGDLVISDGQTPIALAGIMGGRDSEIKPDTTDIVLEVACFDPTKIRATAKRLGLSTESSYRFERSVPVASVKQALDRLATLILQIAGGEVNVGVVDVYPKKEKQRSLVLRKDRLTQIVGSLIPAKKVNQILTSLGFAPQKTASGWRVKVPTNRSDIEREIDLIEEVVRHYGVDAIESCLPSVSLKPVYESQAGLVENSIKQFLTSRGYLETIHLSFCDPQDLQNFGDVFPKAPVLKNPLSQELSCLRPSLLPALLKAYLKNRDGVCRAHRYFELRSVYHAPYGEQKRLAGLYTGKLFEKNRFRLDKEMDFYDGKGLLDQLFEKGGLKSVRFEAGSASHLFHPAQSVTLTYQDKVLGSFGGLHPEILARFEVKERVYYFDLDYSLLSKIYGAEDKKFRTVNDYPKVLRDLALVAAREMPFGEIKKTIESLETPWLTSVNLYDIYEGSPIPENKKSLTLSLEYEDNDKTLTDEEVNKVHFELVNQLKNKLGLELR